MRQNTTQKQTIKWELYSKMVDAVIEAVGEEDVPPGILHKLYEVAKEVVQA